MEDNKETTLRKQSPEDGEAIPLVAKKPRMSTNEEEDLGKMSLDHSESSVCISIEALDMGGIPHEKLQQPCQEDHLYEIARYISDWPSLALSLKMTMLDIESIRVRWPYNLRMQNTLLLCDWRQALGREATYQRLCEAFFDAKQMTSTLVEKVGEILCTSQPPVFTEVDTYSQFLREMYDTMSPQFLFRQWPPPSTQRVFNLAMIKNRDIQCGPVEDERIQQLKRGNVDAYMKDRDPVQLYSLFKLDNAKRKVVLIEGAPGSGKSTLAWHICQKWNAQELFQEFSLVVFISLRDPQVSSAQSLVDLLPVDSEDTRKQVMDQVKADKGKHVLFVLDGWDEYTPGLTAHDSTVYKLICEPHTIGVTFSTLLITSRPIASGELQLKQVLSSRVEIVGFTPKEVSEYFKEVVKDPEDLHDLLKQLDSLPVVKTICYLPLNAVIVAHVFLGQHSLPRTPCGVFSALVCGCIARHIATKSVSKDIPCIPSLDGLPEEVQKPFKKMCSLAYKATVKNQTTFDKCDMASHGISLETNGLGLMQGVQTFLSGRSVSYYFLHLSVQELLAAVHISKLEVSKQVCIFDELNGNPRLASVFHFYSSLTKLHDEEIRKVMIKIVSDKSNRETRGLHVLNFLSCLYEIQNVPLCKYVASQLGDSLDLGGIALSPLDSLCVGYFLWCVCHHMEGFEVMLECCELDIYKVELLLKELGQRVHVSGMERMCKDSGKAMVGTLNLNLSENRAVSGDGVDAMCKWMECYPSVITRLELNHNVHMQDGQDGLLCLLRMLCTNKWLVELKLMGCRLRINDENGPVFTNMLHQNKSLEVLHMGGNDDIGDEGVRYIVEGIAANDGVEKLNLSFCGLTESSGHMLGEMLTKNRSLKILDIRNNNGMRDDGIMGVVEGLKKNTTLQELCIRGCEASFETLTVVKEISHLSHLIAGSERTEQLLKSVVTRKRSTDHEELPVAKKPRLCTNKEEDNGSISLHQAESSAQTYSEALNMAGIPLEKLQQLCKEDHLYEVARYIPDWPSLAFSLNMNQLDIESIRASWPDNVRMQKAMLLSEWQQTLERGATYQRLCEAFLHAEQTVLVEKVREVLCTSQPPVSTEVDTYSQFLRDMYDTMSPQFLFRQWPPPSTRRVFNLAMIKNRGIQCGPVEDERIQELKRGNVDAYMKDRDPVQLYSLFKLDNAKRKVVLIEGAPGSGKSTLAWHICQKWNARELFQEFSLAVFISLRDPQVSSAQSLVDLLPVDSEDTRKQVMDKVKADKGKHVLFVLDGWDEYAPGLTAHNSIVYKLICEPHTIGVTFSTLLMTSRPIATGDLQLKQVLSLRVEIVGFTPEEVSEYFKEVVKDPKDLHDLLDQLDSLPVVKAICYLPLNAVIVAHVFLGQHSLPRTPCGVFSALVCGCIARHIATKSASGDIPCIPSLDDLPEEVQEPFKKMCSLAYKATVKNQTTFDKGDMASHGISLETNGLGLMQGVQTFLSGRSVSYHFLHLSVQELLAAVHISKLEVSEQVCIFDELHSNPRLASVFHFYASLTKLHDEEIRKVMIKIVGDKSNRETRGLHVLNFLCCLYEVQNVPLCKYVASQLGDSLDLGGIALSPLDSLCVGYFLWCVCHHMEGFEVMLECCELDTYKVELLLKELGQRVHVSGMERMCKDSGTMVGTLNLNLSENRAVNGDGIDAMCKWMECYPSVITRLELNHNVNMQECQDGLLCLLRMLCTNKWLVELKLMGCRLRINDENGPVFTDMLHQNKSLKVLHMGGNDDIGDEGVRYIVEGIAANNGVEKLNLSFCGLTESSGRMLGEMLTKNRSLRIFDIRNNNGMRDHGIMGVVKGLKKNTTLQELCIRGCEYSFKTLKFVKENNYLRQLIAGSERTELLLGRQKAALK